MRTWFCKVFEEKLGSAADLVVPVSAHASGRLLYRVSGGGVSAIGAINENVSENKAFSYLTRQFATHALPVPKIYAEDVDRGLVLMEDLGEATLMDVLLAARGDEDSVPERVAALYHQAVSILPLFQIKAGQEIDFTACYPRHAFDQLSMRWDMEYFRKDYLDRLGIPYDDERIQKDFDALIVRLLEAEDNFFMYRDFQARNIMVRDDRCGFIDYQGGRRGPLQYDVVSLLYQSRAALPHDFRRLLIDAYFEAASEVSPLDRDRFYEPLDSFILVRLMQVLGTYGRFGLGQSKQYFRDSIPFALRNVRDFCNDSELPSQLPYLNEILHVIASR